MSAPAPTLAGPAWRTVALLMPVALLNYLDRQMLASMQASVMRDIPTIGTQENWGFLLGQFKWVYAAVSLFGGYAADRFGRRAAVCGSLLAWSAVTWWTGHVTTYSELLWARSLMGFSEAFYIPAALALIAESHTGDTRSRAVGWHQTAIYGGVIAGGFGGYIATDPALGWRSAFVGCGAVGIAYAVPLALLLKDAPRAARATSTHSPRAAARELATNFAFVLLVLYFTLPAMAAWVVRDWMPAILKAEFGLGEGTAGVSATLYWQLAAIVGATVGGAVADRGMRTTIRGRVYASAAGTALIVPAIFGIGNAGSLAVAIAFLALFGLGWGLFDGNTMPILSQIVRPELRATGYGVMNFVSVGCGGLTDWGFGRLRDANVPLNVSFGGFALLAAAAVGLVLLIRPNPALSSPDAR